MAFWQLIGVAIMQNMQKLWPFIMHHWILSAAFVLAVIVMIVIEARSKGVGGARLSAHQLTQLVNREQAVIIDIRDANAFSYGHIINAINIPLADIDQNIKRLEKDKQRPIVIVCAMGQKSTIAMNKLRKLGFEKVYVLIGGMASWRNASMPVVK